MYQTYTCNSGENESLSRGKRSKSASDISAFLIIRVKNSWRWLAGNNQLDTNPPIRASVIQCTGSPNEEWQCAGVFLLLNRPWETVITHSRVLVLANWNVCLRLFDPTYLKIKIWGISGIVWVNIRHLYEVLLKHFWDIGFILWDFVG